MYIINLIIIYCIITIEGDISHINLRYFIDGIINLQI